MDTFFDNYIHNIQKVDNRLDEYIKDPNEKNIHDMRTAIRRLEASYISSPKQIRKRKIIEYVIKSKHLFAINSEIRDFDIILEKLTKEGQLDIQQLEQIEKSIIKSKNRKLKKALSIARDLRKVNAPHLDNYNNKYDLSILQKKITKRYNKIVSKFANKIEKNIPIVISSSEKLDELHEVRKDSKKLRYLLELLLNNRDRYEGNIDKNSVKGENNHSNEQNVGNLIEQLKKIQDMLGNTRDYDITIAYLKQHDRQKNVVTKMNLILQRKNKYDQFVHYYKSAISNIDNNFLIPK
ncbi:MAG: CHAD domain-containing protein [Thermoproteota archaeon]|nr:CHAD domain-containing protein [Thermoproteota archaeon]